MVKDYFSAFSIVDTFLLVNSCARGKAVPESDLDFAVLVGPNTSLTEQNDLEQRWLSYATTNAGIIHYKKSHRFAQIHLDIIDGNYVPRVWDDGGGPDYFEVEIGNQIAYSVPLSNEGSYFQQLKSRWLPHYGEELREQRFSMAKEACQNDLEHIPFFVKRGLYFQAFDRLYKAFQEFLQILFIKHKMYPIAYNKWIKEQMETLLQLPGLYQQLPKIISVTDIESNEVNEKARLLHGLLNEYG